jgi:hypothetical protein
MVWTGTQAKQDSAAPGRAGAIGGASVGWARAKRIRSTGAASVTKAMMRMSAQSRAIVRGDAQRGIE